MPARDKYHDIVIRAMQAEGWTITHDPLPLTYADQDLYVDLGAEYGAIGAQKAGRQIAVEIKTFLRRSAVEDLQNALGQYQMYRMILQETQPEWTLYLAVPERAYESFLVKRFGQFILSGAQIKLLVFNERKEVIVRWIN